MKNETFDFHGSKFTIKVLTSETNGRFTILDVIHLPNWTGELFKEYQEKKMATLPATTIICTIN